MANFKTHITTSSLLGAGLGAGAWLGLDYPLDTCLLSAGLCSIAGMLPDLDSPNSIPVRETVALSAAIIPAFMMQRFERLGLSAEEIILVSALIYFGVRFGIAKIFSRYTVHRGMWHSIPSALIASTLALFICTCDELDYRLFKGVAVFVGFMSHLILDEIYSIDLAGMRVKKSWGTALKFWGKSSWANFSTYAKLGLVLFVLSFDPMMMSAIGVTPNEVPEVAKVWMEKMAERRERRLQKFRERHIHDHDQNPDHEQDERPGDTVQEQPDVASQTVQAENRSAPSADGSIYSTPSPAPVYSQPNYPSPGYSQPSYYPPNTYVPQQQLPPQPVQRPQQLPIQRWPQYGQPQNGQPRTGYRSQQYR